MKEQFYSFLPLSTYKSLQGDREEHITKKNNDKKIYNPDKPLS